MKRTVSVLVLTLIILFVMDMNVALFLSWADANRQFGALVRYFDYGRSVPGKLARWEANPDAPGNLFNVAWPSAMLAQSAEKFAKETEGGGPVIRAYGMSFVKNILHAARTHRPELQVDHHAGPGAPPNLTFSLFLDDRPNRRPGDIAVLGILASSVPGLAALSNRTWVFEQPAPMTYPVFRLSDDGLERIDPLVQTAEQQRSLSENLEAARAWVKQLSTEDVFFSTVAFGVPILDTSPFARLVRRSLAVGAVEDTKEQILTEDAYPYEEVLRRMIVAFAATARDDGQIPVVMLIQTHDRRDADVLAIVAPVLEEFYIPYFATAEQFDPNNISGFVADGHYKNEIDDLFGRKFLEVLDGLEQ